MTVEIQNVTFRNTLRETQNSGSVSIATASAFLEYACSMGARREDLLSVLGRYVEQIYELDARIPVSVYLSLIRHTKETLCDPSVLVNYASHADFSEVSIAGLIANASETMLDALVQLNRYGRLALELPIDGAIALKLERYDAFDLIVDHRVFPEDGEDLVESSMIYLITGPRRFLPEKHVEAVTVVHPRPEHADAFEAICDCPVTYGAPRNTIRLPKWVADHQVKLQPAYAFGILTRHADEMLEDLRLSSTFSGALEALIAPSLHTGDVSADWAAAKLGISRQTLYRELKAEGVTFALVLENLRERLAKEYLSAKKISVAETAYLLGFSDASPFHRAFRRWTGSSPREYRANV